MTATLVAELPELGSLSRAKIAKLMGVAPMIKQSGKSEGKRQVQLFPIDLHPFTCSTRFDFSATEYSQRRQCPHRAPLRLTQRCSSQRCAKNKSNKGCSVPCLEKSRGFGGRAPEEHCWNSKNFRFSNRLHCLILRWSPNPSPRFGRDQGEGSKFKRCG